jgi:AcrR family transcriptional regulator
MNRIVEAAREHFTERGFDGTTTREIAQRADVSETLIFRYFGNKQGLFDHIAYTPFHKIVDHLLNDLEVRADGADPIRLGQEALVKFVSNLAESHRLMAVLAVRGPPDTSDERTAAQMEEMRLNFERAASLIGHEMATGARGLPEDLPPDTLVRLLFGMTVSSVLFADWLFPEGQPDAESLAAAIRRIIIRVA